MVLGLYAADKKPLVEWMNKRYLFRLLIVFSILLMDFPPASFSGIAASSQAPSVTILCYLNGDNDLSQEVLHTLDMMETVGSSAQVNVIALVDGHPNWLGPYKAQWANTRLVRLESDPVIGIINSRVLEEWGEENLGNPATLRKFIQTAIARYPADRYLFYTFAHSQGVIETRRYAGNKMGKEKTVSISRDDTDQETMTLSAFKGAIQGALDGRRFELMVLFSCLTNMVEVGYALSEVTDYMVGSEDEIRLVNQPAGSYQIRGLHFEEVIAQLRDTPSASAQSLGRRIVDSHVNNYQRDVVLPTEPGTTPDICRFPAGMALVDCGAMDSLVRALDDMAGLFIAQTKTPGIVAGMRNALSETQRFASFLNMEYYDLQGFVRHLRSNLQHPDLQKACDDVLNILLNKVLLYERHTEDCKATGMSIYLSNPLIPENIYQTHQSMYLDTRFSKETRWDEMIDAYRQLIRE